MATNSSTRITIMSRYCVPGTLSLLTPWVMAHICFLLSQIQERHRLCYQAIPRVDVLFLTRQVDNFPGFFQSQGTFLGSASNLYGLNPLLFAKIKDLSSSLHAKSGPPIFGHTGILSSTAMEN